MKKTQQAIIDAAYALCDRDSVRTDAGRELLRAVDADRANTDPEPEVMTAEAKALIEAISKYAVEFTERFGPKKDGAK